MIKAKSIIFPVSYYHVNFFLQHSGQHHEGAELGATFLLSYWFEKASNKSRFSLSLRAGRDGAGTAAAVAAAGLVVVGGYVRKEKLLRHVTAFFPLFTPITIIFEGRAAYFCGNSGWPGGSPAVRSISS